MRPPVIVLGGYGTFGRIVARELARRGPVAIAGRSLARARAMADSLGGVHEALACDVSRPDSLAGALVGRRVAVFCSGPFQETGRAGLAAALAAGCHSVDIADERGWCGEARGRSKEFAAKGLTAAYGCSSLPGISGALAQSLAEDGVRAVRARLTLFVGNGNPKGAGAILSVAHAIGRPIAAPQGTLLGFAGRERVEIPGPFQARPAWDFDSPEYDLFPALLDIHHVQVKASFELALAGFLFGALARTGLPARWLVALGKLAPRFGHSGGAVIADLWDREGRPARASVSCPEGGQRMAALPAVFATEALLAGKGKPGAWTAWELLGAKPLLERLAGEGYALSRTPARSGGEADHPP